MDDVTYAFAAIFGMILLFVLTAICLCGFAFLFSQARQAWQELRTARMKRRKEWVAGHLIEQVRNGKLGI